jgi:SAM-dependent methyltransferase
MLDEAVKTVTSAEHYRAVRGVLAIAMQLPFEGGRFDALCAMHMLYHLPDPAQALGEMRRLLRPGGRFAITTSGRDTLRALHALSAQVFGGAGVDPAAVTFGPADAEALLADGFKDIKTEVLRDPYAVTDHRDLLHYPLSFSPASDASEEQLEQLKKLILEKMQASGGVFHLRTEAALITAHA